MKGGGWGVILFMEGQLLLSGTEQVVLYIYILWDYNSDLIGWFNSTHSLLPVYKSLILPPGDELSSILCFIQISGQTMRTFIVN